MHKIYSKIILILLTMFLSGCGFHLRKARDLPAPLKNMYVKSSQPYSRFTTDLKATLRTSGIKVRKNIKDADTILFINNSHFTGTTSSTALTTQARVYTFTFATKISIQTKKHKTILRPKVISTSRTLNLNPNEILDSSTQTTIVKRETERSVIGKILYQIDAKQVRDNLAKLK